MMLISGSELVEDALLGGIYPTENYRDLQQLSRDWAIGALDFLDVEPVAESVLVGEVSDAYRGHGGEAFVGASRPLFHGDSSWSVIGNAVAGLGACILDNAEAMRASAYSMLLQVVATFADILRAALDSAMTVFGEVELPGVIAILLAFGRAIEERLAALLTEDLASNAAPFALVRGAWEIGKELLLHDTDSLIRSLAVEGLKGAVFSAAPQLLAEGKVDPGQMVESAAAFAGGRFGGELAGDKFGSWINQAWRSRAGLVVGRLTTGFVGGFGSTLGMLVGSELAGLATTGEVSDLSGWQFAQGAIWSTISGFRGMSDLPAARSARSSNHSGMAPPNIRLNTRRPPKGAGSSER